MLKTIGLLIKLSIFTLLVLILGNWIRWDGKTISDQVKIRMAHAERRSFLETVRGWAAEVTHDARLGTRRKSDPGYTIPSQEEISSSERQKLKALIRELNSSHKRN